MKTTHNLTVPLAPTLSSPVQQCHLLQNLNTESLISIGKLCYDNCTATFSKENVIIAENDKTIIHGNRSKVDGLWRIPLPKYTLPPCTYQTLNTTKTTVSSTPPVLYSNIRLACKHMTKNLRDNVINAMPSTLDKHLANSTIRCARYKNELANFLRCRLQPRPLNLRLCHSPWSSLQGPG